MIGGKILTYRDVLQTVLGEKSELLVNMSSLDSTLVAKYEKPDMKTYTGEDTYVRKSVAEKLVRVNEKLSLIDLCLKVVYGYRHPEVQEKYFFAKRALLALENPALSDEALDELTHTMVAVPDVAGHPTGGAVDVTILDAYGIPLDMGTKIADYSDPEKIKTFANGLSDVQKQNRRLLHDLMVSVDFAPFYGEWWHFSYGDREWARFYGKPSSLYSPIHFLA